VGDKEKRRPDFETEGLLEGLEEGPREARRRLLERFFDAGFSFEELKDAVADDRLVLLPAEHVLGEEPRYTAREIAAKTGLPHEYLLAVLQPMVWLQQTLMNAPMERGTWRPHGRRARPSSRRDAAPAGCR
jgi:hypothetical protein